MSENNKEELKACPFCRATQHYFSQTHNRIIHEDNCYFKDDTIIDIKQDAWNTRANELKPICEDGVSDPFYARASLGRSVMQSKLDCWIIKKSEFNEYVKYICKQFGSKPVELDERKVFNILRAAYNPKAICSCGREFEVAKAIADAARKGEL